MTKRDHHSTYANELAWLYALAPRGIKFGLTRMKRAIRMRSLDLSRIAYVHVAGTNGKGSVSAMIEQGLRSAGHKTGLFTSPHLSRFAERVRVNGSPIDNADAARRIRSIRLFLTRPGAPKLSFFEAATLLALETFIDAGVDIAVMEVGLGGRLDTTNVIPDPLVSVITSIAKDHEQYLGTTLARIAGEKAGIIRRRTPLVSNVSSRSVAGRVVAKTCATERAPIIDAVTFVREARGHKRVLQGEHQVGNAACALAALSVVNDRGFRVPPAAKRAALERVRWPARLEVVRGVLFDAAHNPEGARSLAAHLSSVEKPVTLVFGVMRDKSWREMLKILAPRCRALIATLPSTGRALAPGEIVRLADSLGIASSEVVVEPAAALARAREIARGSRVVVTGSLYLVGELRARVLGQEMDPVITM